MLAYMASAPKGDLASTPIVFSVQRNALTDAENRQRAVARRFLYLLSVLSGAADLLPISISRDVPNKCALLWPPFAPDSALDLRYEIVK